MTDNEIFQLAEKFRSAILRANANGEFFRDPAYPKTFRPQLYISSSKEINAVAIGNGEIVIYAGLIFKVIELIEQKYTDDILNECVPGY